MRATICLRLTLRMFREVNMRKFKELFWLHFTIMILINKRKSIHSYLAIDDQLVGSGTVISTPLLIRWVLGKIYPFRCMSISWVLILCWLNCRLLLLIKSRGQPYVMVMRRVRELPNCLAYQIHIHQTNFDLKVLARSLYSSDNFSFYCTVQRAGWNQS